MGSLSHNMTKTAKKETNNVYLLVHEKKKTAVGRNGFLCSCHHSLEMQHRPAHCRHFVCNTHRALHHTDSLLRLTHGTALSPAPHRLTTSSDTRHRALHHTDSVLHLTHGTAPSPAPHRLTASSDTQHSTEPCTTQTQYFI